MKKLDRIRDAIRAQQPYLAEKYGVSVVGVFGSYARGEQKRKSDLDLLVDILRPIGLFELVGAELYLSDLLRIKVDLVPKRAVRKELKDGILAETVPL